MDNFSASKYDVLANLLAIVKPLEITDAKFFLQFINEDESMEVLQKVELITSVAEALSILKIQNMDDQFTLFNITAKKYVLRKKKYIKKKDRRAFNVAVDLSSSDEKVDSNKYTRPYRQYKAKKYLKKKNTSVAENSGVAVDPPGDLRDAQNSEARLTESTRATGVSSSHNSTKNLVPRVSQSESAELCLDKFIRDYIDDIYCGTKAPDYKKLQGLLKLTSLSSSNRHVKKEPLMSKASDNDAQTSASDGNPEKPDVPASAINLEKSDVPASPINLEKPAVPASPINLEKSDLTAIPSTSTGLIEQEHIYEKHYYTIQYIFNSEEDTS